MEMVALNVPPVCLLVVLGCQREKLMKPVHECVAPGKEPIYPSTPVWASTAATSSVLPNCITALGWGCSGRSSRRKRRMEQRLGMQRTDDRLLCSEDSVSPGCDGESLSESHMTIDFPLWFTERNVAEAQWKNDGLLKECERKRDVLKNL